MDEQTYGMKAVGITFNPSGDVSVTKIKEKIAELIDLLDDFRKIEADNMKSGEHKRLASIAITELQAAQMWAVKAVTWKDY